MKKQKLPSDIKIGIIGGSGVYNIEGLQNVKKYNIVTPFGKPSDNIIVGELEGKKVAFLPRHGRGHTISPTEINVHANIYALKLLGVEFLISISACGSLKEEIKPRDFILPYQIYDRTKFRKPTFFGDSIVCHISFAEPFCKNLRELVYNCCKELNIEVHYGGIYVCIEGPQFSTKAESEYHRRQGYSVIGMTVATECKVAKEAGLHYSAVSLVTDYDCWKEEDEVSQDKVIETLNKNISNVKKLLLKTIPEILNIKPSCKCQDIMKTSLLTSRNYISKKNIQKLKLIIG